MPSSTPHAPPVAFLDEPTKGLDPLAAHGVRAFLRREVSSGLALLLTSHILGDVEALADRVAVVHQARIRTEASPATLVAALGAKDALEYLFATPGSRYGYLAGAVLAELALGLVGFVPLFGLLLWTAQPGLAAAALTLGACLLLLVALTALGVLVALLAILWRQAGAVAEVLGVVFEMLAGAYLPVHAFPTALRGLAYALPFTLGYDLVRHYAMGARWQTILPVGQEWAMIGAHAALYTALSVHLLGRAERRAKRTGLHAL